MAAASSYPSKAKSAARFVKKATPVVLELYRRWQAMPPEQRERYIKTAREYVDRAAEVARSSSQSGKRKKKN